MNLIGYDEDVNGYVVGAVVVMTGKEDWISDGETVLKLSNGHHLVSKDK